MHSSAIIDPGAVIGAGTRVWHFVHVMSGAVVGDSCVVGQGCFIAGGARIGSGVKLQNHVSVFDGVTLEDDVFCGPSVVFTNVRNPRASVPRKDRYRRTLVRRGATLGANCTVLPGVTIGEFAFVAAGATVTRDVPDFALVVGAPARCVAWMSPHGERLVFDATGQARCPATGEAFALLDGGARAVRRIWA